MRKTFLLDTSVLLYDQTSIHSFDGNDVVLPLRVIDELDKFKEAAGVLGESARYVNRFLDKLREFGSLLDGVKIPEEYAENQIIRISLSEDLEQLPVGLRDDRGDNRILATALSEVQANKESDDAVIVITKDINLRVKCDALGISAEDLIKDQVTESDSEYSGYSKMTVDKSQVDSFFKSGLLNCEDENLSANEFVILSNDEQSSGLGIHKHGVITPLIRKPDNMKDYKAKNVEQKFATEALLDPAISLLTLVGLAGSGKTYISLMAAMDGLQSGRYKRIIISRSIQPVGKDLGYLPGDIDEKMQPWLAPIVDNFKTMFHDNSYFEMMIERGEIEVAPLAYIRGRTFNDSFVMVDEAQNASIHELKTLITRVGKNSKIVLLGDVEQIDTAYLSKASNGLSVVAHKFRNEPCAAHVKLVRGQRSDLATRASLIL